MIKHRVHVARRFICFAGRSEQSQSKAVGEMEERMPCISIPHKQLIGLGFFHPRTLPFGSKLHFPLSLHNYYFSLFIRGKKKNQKHDINTFVKGTHFTSNIVCRQESPATGLTSLCLRSAHICMSYYNAAARGLLGAGGG